MIAHWMRVGFVHGVMNTDNMSIHGLTIDYGPTDGLRTSISVGLRIRLSGRKRYRFGNQADIGGWNIARFLEAVSPLMENPQKLTMFWIITTGIPRNSYKNVDG